MDFKLIVKKLKKSLTREEERIFTDWYNESDAHRRYFENVKASYKNPPFKVDLDEGWRQISKKIEGRNTVKKVLWKYIVAASFILAISGSVFFFLNKNPLTTISSKSEIKAGNSKAVLTLANGQNIVLENGVAFANEHLSSNGKELFYSNNNAQAKSVEYNYLTIPRGGQFFVSLADSTKVWLNSESKLKYPAHFTKGIARTVELLYGEAFFDVSHATENDGSKFIVKTATQDVSVLGTKFNIKANKGKKNTYTTLVEGKIEVSSGATYRMLEPGEQFITTSNSSDFKLIEVDTDYQTSWVNGVFSFNDEPLKNIMSVLSRWYNIDVVFQNNTLEKLKFNGKFSKNQSLEDILSTIQSTGNFTYSIKDNNIVIK